MSDWDNIFTSPFGRMFAAAASDQPLAREWQRTAAMLRAQGHDDDAEAAGRTAIALLPRGGAR